MNSIGWVKLHRTLLDHEILRDHTAWVIFSWLLLSVNKDTGKRSIGRYQVCDELGIKPPTYYKALKRLQQKYRVIEVSSIKTHSEVYVVNWGKYQHANEGQYNESIMAVKSNDNESNTKQEYKNIRIKKERDIIYLSSLPQEDIEEFTTSFTCSKSQVISKAETLQDYCNSHGVKYKDYKSTLRNWLRKDYGKRIPTAPAFNPADYPEISEAERLRNLDKLAQMKNSLMKPMVN